MIDLAARGFHLFCIEAGGKRPAFKGWQDEAAPKAIAPGYNVGIFTGRFGADRALLVVDIDTKKGKNGYASLAALEMRHGDLPDTFEVETPSGGRHLYFSVAAPVRQGADILGEGLDVRSRGGYVVGPGSDLGGSKIYRARADRPVAPAPEWLVAACGDRVRRDDQRAAVPAVPVSQSVAADRAIRYLTTDAPLAVEGVHGDETTYKVACRLRDMGLDFDAACAAMAEHWNSRCSPPWPFDELRDKVANAWKYGVNQPGAAAPEADFQPVIDAPAAEQRHPFEELNKEYAFVLAGGGDHILWETTDASGRWTLTHLNTGSFHRKHAAQKLQVGKREQPLTELWMEWKGRRSYDGLVFLPERPAPARFYNLWRGFAVPPLLPDERPGDEARAAVDAWLEHAHRNVCRGRSDLYHWLVAYFAHMVQRPWEKPLTALVMRGGKGVGKNALVERVADLLGRHAMVADDERYLLGNFNEHMENMLFFILDEAAWAGNKKAEGKLKGLITGREHVIEPKGEKTYRVQNLTRVAIIGNEDWLVPASSDERRFAVFDVGEGRKQDLKFFEDMRIRMDAGGNRWLLRYLLDYDIGNVNVNQAPITKALYDQKVEALEVTQQWWLSCLYEGRLICSDFGEDWPAAASCDRIRQALKRYSQERQVRSRLPNDAMFGRQFTAACKSADHKKLTGGWHYLLPPLEHARRDWESFIGHTVDWER